MKLFRHIKTTTLTALLLTGVGSPSMSYADDTEVFRTSSTALNPNVLFIMDNSTSMGQRINGKTRLAIMKDTLSAVLADADSNLNVGITNYGSAANWRNDYAGGIKYPVKPLNSLVKPVIENSLKDRNGQIMWRHHRGPAPVSSYPNRYVSNFDTMTVREYIPEVANSWVASGNTPIVDALYEAALYFRGGAIKWWDVAAYGGRAHYRAAAHPSTYEYPASTFFESAAFPGHEYPFVPQWYADNLSNKWESRSTNENKWYFKYFKEATPFWYTGWIKCPPNTGYPHYTVLKDSGPSTLENCRIMRNDFVEKVLQDNIGSVFNRAVNRINNGGSTSVVDTEVHKAILQTSDDDLEAAASSVVTKFGKKVYKFDAFPRCRVIEEVVCGPVGARHRTQYYKCRAEGAEQCRAWKYEQCANPSTAHIEKEVICDFDQNISRYPNSNYISPILGDCQSNYIVLMSDGKPEYSTSNVTPRVSLQVARRTIQAMTGTECANDPYFKEGTCGPELTHYLATEDQMPGTDSKTIGDQFVNTLVIGFSDTVSNSPNAANYLESLVTLEDKTETPEREGFFLANNQEELVKAFKDALSEIVVVTRSQASPGYSVNVKNGLEHEDDIYIPVFDLENASRWSGNLKKFKLSNVNGKRYVRGKNNLDATDELGGFTTDAIDYWSDAPNTDPDGSIVEKGGLANKLNSPGSRRIYSNLTSNKNLYDPSNHFKTTNMSHITNSILGLPSTSTLDYRKKLVRFMRGRKNGDENGDPRFHMGDMLHSEPLVVTYNKGSSDGSDKKQYIFAATNEGYLHAFDTSDTGPNAGKEMFSFIPKELLGIVVEPQFLNTGIQADHKYGVDGALTVWFKDDGVKGVVDGNDQVILYFGLRRGGTSFYALDVTDINKPKFLWQKSAADYPSMGQSWSTPYLAKVGVGSDKTPREVMIISGGYDEDEDRDLSNGSGDVDNAQSSVTSNVGNDVLILDAKTGAKVWSLPDSMRSQITNSIPGGVRILDTNYNGLVDRMYFADTGGNVWRLDLTEEVGGSSAESELTKFAELGGTGRDARKFYNEPDVAKMKLRGKIVFAISVGSGFRAHPLDRTIDDKFFVLVDKSPYNPLVKTGEEEDIFSTITTSSDDLAEITITGTAISQIGSIKDTNKRGWKVNFGSPGEKVLGSALAFDGNIVFTSLVPEALMTNCSPPVVNSRLYAINILSGKAGLDLDSSGGKPNDAKDAYITTSTEILGRPQVVFNPATVTDVVDPVTGDATGAKSCRHPVDIRTGKKLTQSTGYDACRLESVYWSDPIPE